MKENMIYVKSASNFTLVVNVPEIPLNKTWTKRGQRMPIDRDQLIIAYYHPAVEALFKKGMLTTDDTEFLKEVGLMEEDGTTEIVLLSDELLKRMISVMPISDLKAHLKKLSHSQIDELCTYAVDNYKILKNDRIELLSKVSCKDIYKEITNFRAAQEE